MLNVFSNRQKIDRSFACIISPRLLNSLILFFCFSRSLYRKSQTPKLKRCKEWNRKIPPTNHFSMFDENWRRIKKKHIELNANNSLQSQTLPKAIHYLCANTLCTIFMAGYNMQKQNIILALNYDGQKSINSKYFNFIGHFRIGMDNAQHCQCIINRI